MADKTEKKGRGSRRVRDLPPAKYTEQLVLLISKDARAVIDLARREHGISQAAAARAFLYAGMKAAGYTELQTTDEPGNQGRAVEVARLLQHGLPVD